MFKTGQTFRRRDRRRPLLFVLGPFATVGLFLLGGGAARAAELRGTVRDPQGLVVPGAQLRLGGGALATAQRSAVADAGGRYRFADLPAGEYVLRAFAAGFEMRTIEADVADETAIVDLQLPVAALHEGVVVTASRQEQIGAESPLPTALVSDERLNEQMPTNLAQGLQEIPGVTWVNAGAFRSRPVIRGLDSNRVLVLVDGERLNNGRTSTVNAGIETSLVDLSDIEQVEVVRGPGSVLYGSDAFGGVINIRTRNAQPSEAFRVGVKTGGSLIPNADGERGYLEAFAAGPRFSARARGSAASFEDFSSPAGRVFGSGVDQSGALGDLRFDPAAGHSLNFKFQHGGGYNFGLPTLSPNPVFFAEFPFSKLTKFRGGYSGSFNSPLLSSLRLNLYRQVQTRDFFTRIQAGPATLFSDTVTDVDSTGFDAQATTTAGSRHVLTYGASYFRDSNTDRRLQTMLSRGRLLVLDDSPSVPNSTFEGLGFFVQSQFQATSRLRFIAGARIDDFTLETDPTPNFDPAAADFIAGSREDTAFGGNIGASFDFAPGWSVSGNLGRAFRQPNLFERFFFGPGSVGGFVAPNPDLDPETSLQYDVGLHFRRGPARASVNYFYNDLSDQIVSAPGMFLGSDTFNGQPVTQNVNVADSRIQGIEASAEYVLEGWGSRWTPLVSLSWQRGDNRADDEPLPLIAPFLGQAGLRWSPRGSRAWSEFRVRTAKSSDRVPPGFNPIQAFTVFTWRGGYEITRDARGLGALLPRGLASISIHASVENFADRLYRGLFEIVPQPGRDFRFGIDLNFDSTAR